VRKVENRMKSKIIKNRLKKTTEGKGACFQNRRANTNTGSNNFGKKPLSAFASNFDNGMAPGAGGKLRVYPTLVSGVVTVTSSVALRSVDLYTMTGQLVAVKAAAGGDLSTWQMDMTGLSRGIYLVKSIDIKGGFMVTKLMKL